MPQDELHCQGSICSSELRQRYTRGELIGQGAFKRVYKSFDEATGVEVAWNEVSLNDKVSTAKDRNRIFSEIQVLQQLKHSNIIKLLDWSFETETQTLFFLTELFTDGTLRQYRRKHKKVDLVVLKRWAWQILQGLVYLHGHNPPIIHRDLKCDNVFINGSSGIVKIGDLGFATVVNCLQSGMSVIGTPEFMAPELYDEWYDEKVDVYAFGLCILELATLEYPYCECKNPAQIYKKVTQGLPPASLEKVHSEELRSFIELCICPDPLRRPHARQLLKHPFFDSVKTMSQSGGGTEGIPQVSSDKVLSRTSFSSLAVDYTRDTLDAGRVPVSAPLQHAQLDSPAPSINGAFGRGNGASSAPLELEANESSSMISSAASETTGVEGNSSPRKEDELNSILGLSCRFLTERTMSFKLNYVNAEGIRKRIAFNYDATQDTPTEIAHELVENLSFNERQAGFIAGQIQRELAAIATSNEDVDSPGLGSETSKELVGSPSFESTLRGSPDVEPTLEPGTWAP